MSDLQRVVTLARIFVAQREMVERLEGQLAEAKAEARRLETEDLPELMREIGLARFELDDGSVIDVVDDVECSVSEERRAAAVGWLEANGFGGLIKTEVVVRFGKGEHDAAQRCAEETGGEARETIHPSTLKAFVKEQLAAGRPVPFETFGIRPFSRAKIKPPRGK